MDFGFAANVVNMMIALIISLTFHEAAHALVARLHGDRTAQYEGRLTLNPVPHIDPVGTLIFPMVGAMLGGFIFGWAKPVPVDSRHFKNQKRGNILVAFAGPAANLLLSIVSLAIFYAIGPVEEGSIWVAFSRLAQAMITLNAILAIFNLIPLYPLDGGAIIYELLSYDLRRKYEEYVIPYGGFVLLALMLLGGLAWVSAVAGVWVGIAQVVVRPFF
ncbi:MAG: site-2 protease family protein [Oligoflexus sp.]|jgi:Zn-dependent protease